MKRNMIFFLRPGSGRKMKFALTVYRSHFWATVLAFGLGTTLSAAVSWFMTYAGTNRGPQLAVYLGYNMVVSFAVLPVAYFSLWGWAKRTVKAGLQGDIACFPDSGTFTALYALMANHGMSEKHMTTMKAWLTTSGFDTLHRLSCKVRVEGNDAASTLALMYTIVVAFKDAHTTDNQPEQEQPA